jgi:hypothetical protein
LGKRGAWLRLAASHINVDPVTKNEGRPFDGLTSNTAGDVLRANHHLSFIASGIDRERYRAVPFYSDGKPGPAIELRDLFAQFLNEVSGSK